MSPQNLTDRELAKMLAIYSNEYARSRNDREQQIIYKEVMHTIVAELEWRRINKNKSDQLFFPDENGF